VKFRNKVMAGIGALAIAGSIGLAAPASAGVHPEGATVSRPDRPLITQRADISFKGSGNYLASCGVSGDNVYFIASPGGCFYILWNYQAEGSWYYLHPSDNNGLCLTASTTQYGVLKIEGCVGASNQFWKNPNSGGYYQDYSDYYGNTYILDPASGGGHTDPASLGNPYGFGNNGETFQQIA
jgi:hypothetical protein